MEKARVQVEVDVPVYQCAKCHRKEPARIVGVPQKDSTIVLRAVSSFTPTVVDGVLLTLCDTCRRFIRGALEAAGLQFPSDPPVS